ncbi:50S ribosomal protein L24 [Candidatus Saccharibacteria bacterium RIFCSPHIGHO2_12_FULL_41_12]|nr:MAG: 50S ribosomal protein L24 [Candidatus Saccharibacteria bacterium RIFCSPHIGHO2_12_FULL_41_12]
MRLKKGDTVVVLAGKDKGKTGIVESTHPRENKVTVKGINVYKKAVKPDKTHPKGGIIDITKPIWVSKVALQEPTSKKPSKIGYKLTKDGTKVRIYKRTGKGVK